MEALFSSHEKIIKQPRKKTRRSRKKRVPISPTFVFGSPDSTTDLLLPLAPLPAPPALISTQPEHATTEQPAAKPTAKLIAKTTAKPTILSPRHSRRPHHWYRSSKLSLWTQE
ncbi:hypothetical protein PUN28_008222 [Cardiocondyla obscurior]|uniref:Uncharacterized protein n=1 Tax=Cardiocondyla obscurior TaxID=286306 RepID=A0AAW2FZ75_9HYME